VVLMMLPRRLASGLNTLRNKPFAAAVAKLVSGTLGAQLIGIAALPVLSRLYTPSDFKALAVYTAIVSILSVVACLRFDFAIPLPKSDFSAANLLVMSLMVVGAVSVLTTGVVA